MDCLLHSIAPVHILSRGEVYVQLVRRCCQQNNGDIEMNINLSQSDQQQKQPKEKRTRKLVKKLRNPRTLFFLIRLGVGAYRAIKWLIELMDL